MYMNNTEPVEIDEYRLELENRIRNLLWTVSGDYQLDMKPDVSLFLRSKAIALYDGIKQGALARYYDKDMLGGDTDQTSEESSSAAGNHDCTGDG